jgi:pSer/pThr/pTyr-binding forkhead associated (FHA) protein
VVIAVHGPLTLGRDPASDVALTDDQLVSARHARLLPSADGVLVEDLGSRNGTYVDGIPLGEPVVARPGSWILAGATTLDVDLVASPGYVLAFVDGATVGRMLTIARTLVVGRADDADVVIAGDEEVGDRHARLTPSAEGVLVEDLGSGAGTVVGGSRITRPTLARVGDRVEVGSTAMEIRSRPETAYALQVVEGPAAGRSLRVEHTIELGRGPSAGFVLEDDELVSRLHTRVTPADDGLLVEDLGSANGTVVNGRPILEPTSVGLGDRLRLGDTTLKVVRAEDLDASATVLRRVPES